MRGVRTTALVLIVSALAASAQAQTVNGRAFAVEGEVLQLIGPVITIPAQPNVVLPAGGGTAQGQVLNLNVGNGLLGNLLSSGTAIARTTSETNHLGNPIPINTGIYSEARVENLNIGGLVALLPPILSAQALGVSCREGPTGLVGQMDIADLNILGLSVPTPPLPNSPAISIQLLPGVEIGSLALNQQVTTTGPGTKTLTVTGIHLTLLQILGLIGGADITLLRAECTVATPPTTSSLSPTSGPSTGGTTVTVTGTNFLQGASVLFDATPGTSVNVLNNTTLTVVSPPHAPGVANVTVTTAGGTSTSLPFTYLPVPGFTSLAPTSGPLSGGQTVVITGSGFVAPASVTFGGNAATVTNVTPTQITVVTPAGAAPGLVNVTVSTPGGSAGPLPYTYVAVPTLTGITPNAGPVAGGNSVTLTGTNFGSNPSDVTVLFGATPATVTSVSPTAIMATVPPGAAPGAVSVTVTTTGGTTGPVGYAYVDGPALESITPNKGPVTGGTALTIVGQNFQAGATVTVGGNPATNVVVVNSTTITAVTPPGAKGPATVVVTHPGGTASGAFTYISAPGIGDISPDTGTPGTDVTITGGGFEPNATVQICGQTVPVTFISPTVVHFIAPPCPDGGPQDVTLTNPDGGSATVPDGFTYLDDADDDPTISGVNPSAGPPAGGTPVTIKGSDFQPGATVLFDNSPATNVVVVDASTITALTPPHAEGVVNVTVTTAGGSATLPGGFTYRAGLPTDCAETFGLDPNDTGGDPDGDGLTNLTECTSQPPTHPKGHFTRYLAEGAANSFFSLRLALFNPTDTRAVVLLTFLQSGGGTFSHIVPLNPHQRLTLDPKTLVGFLLTDFSTTIESDFLVVVDRQMTWDNQSRFGSHAETASASRSTTWYLAEGSTSGPFSLFYLLQNPQSTPVTATVRYLRALGEPPIVKTYDLPAFSRRTIFVDEEDPGLVQTDVSGVIEATQPIAVERAMYMDQAGVLFAAGHDSAGVTSPATEWFLAEGATGPFFELFVLIANPNPTAAQVRVDYMLLGGTPLTKQYTVPGNSRFTIWVDEEELPAGSGLKPLANVAVSTRVRSENGVPIIVERAMWWPQPVWYESHNSPGATSTGARWALAEGEVGGADGVETYVLIANVSDHAGQASVTLYFEDGTTASKVFDLPASSRVNVQATVEFPAAAGKRFATIVQSLGASPVELVVERAMYTSPGGQTWGAGTNAVATKLP